MNSKEQLSLAILLIQEQSEASDFLKKLKIVYLLIFKNKLYLQLKKCIETKF
jgi:hypothetical protein